MIKILCLCLWWITVASIFISSFYVHDFSRFELAWWLIGIFSLFITADKFIDWVTK